MEARHPDPLMEITLESIVSHPLNPNVMDDPTRAKLEEHVHRSGRYPPLIVRPLDGGSYQVLDGHQRLEVLRALDARTASCVVWEASDQEAMILIATLNRLQGQDIPSRRAALLRELAQHETLAELAKLLPEDEAELAAAVAISDLDVDALAASLATEAERAAAAAPQRFSFAVDPTDAPTVEAALKTAAASLAGTNRRGRALVLLAHTYLDGDERRGS